MQIEMLIAEEEVEYRPRGKLKRGEEDFFFGGGSTWGRLRGAKIARARGR